MTDMDKCSYCRMAGNSVISSRQLTRFDALMLYTHLQGRGEAPSMCETTDGKCRVCYSPGVTPTAAGI